MDPSSSPVAPRRPLRIALVAGLCLIVAILAIVGVTARPHAERWLRATVVATLEARLDSDVELGALSVRPGPVTRISGGPLTIRHRGHPDVAPLVRIERFETTVSWRQLLRRPRRVDAVVLTGLEVAVPPSKDSTAGAQEHRSSGAQEDSTAGAQEHRSSGAQEHRRAGAQEDSTAGAQEHRSSGAQEDSTAGAQEHRSSGTQEQQEYRSAGAQDRSSGGEPGPRRTPAVVIDRVTADAATLVVLPRDRRKLPRRFVMHKLTVRDISTDRPMAFDAVIENPKPRGRIETIGTFGPWDVAEPARTPLKADYKFVDADLSTIKGIAGILQSEGTYGGQLERIEAVGTSITPAFDLDVGGRPLSVDARFTVVVDGTNGNTYIQPAEAILGARTPIRVTGGVVKAEDRRGRTVDLAMAIADGRLEEVLALVVNGEPAMRGRIRVDASLLIPPGPEKVLNKMVLEGRFSLADTRFTSQVVQAKLDELSQRAQGRLDDPTVTRVVSAFSGKFRMADGVISFPALSFEVDGARVELAGRYIVVGQGLDFAGRIQLSAGVSQMIRGRKAALLRPFDGLFRRDGFTEFPIHIRGTVDKPEFGVDVKQTLGRALLPGR